MMQTIKTIGNFTFTFKPEAVVMRCNRQVTVFHAYNTRLQNLETFGRRIMQQKNIDYDKVYRFARQTRINGMAGSHHNEQIVNPNPIRRIVW